MNRATLLARAARLSPVAPALATARAKRYSVLNTMARPGWCVAALKPFVDQAVVCSGAERLIVGSDWPIRPMD